MATPSAAPIWKAVLLRPSEPGLVLGDAREGGDRGGDEARTDAGPVDEEAEEHVVDAAAAGRDLREDERPSCEQRHARRHRPEADLEHAAWLTIDPIAAMIVKTAVPSPNSTAE